MLLGSFVQEYDDNDETEEDTQRPSMAHKPSTASMAIRRSESTQGYQPGIQ